MIVTTCYSPLLAFCIVAETYADVTLVFSANIRATVVNRRMHTSTHVLIQEIIIVGCYTKATFSHSLHILAGQHSITSIEDEIMCGWQRYGSINIAISTAAVLDFCVGIISAIRNHAADVVLVGYDIIIIPKDRAFSKAYRARSFLSEAILPLRPEGDGGKRLLLSAVAQLKVNSKKAIQKLVYITGVIVLIVGTVVGIVLEYAALVESWWAPCTWLWETESTCRPIQRLCRYRNEQGQRKIRFKDCVTYC